MIDYNIIPKIYKIIRITRSFILVYGLVLTTQIALFQIISILFSRVFLCSGPLCDTGLQFLLQISLVSDLMHFEAKLCTAIVQISQIFKLKVDC